MKLKKVLVTGGSRGIGRALVMQLREKGFDVIAPSRNELNLLKSTSIDAFIDKFANDTFYAIICNAGINELAYIDEIQERDLHDILEVNLIAPIRLIRGLVKNMKKNRDGHIINISSIFGIVS